MMKGDQVLVRVALLALTVVIVVGLVVYIRTKNEAASLALEVQSYKAQIEQLKADCQSVVGGYTARISELEAQIRGLSMSNASREPVPSPPAATEAAVPTVSESRRDVLPEPTDTPTANYNLHGTRDVSFGSCVRIVADVVLREEQPLSNTDLVTVAQNVVRSIVANKRVNAIVVFFWGPESGVGQGGSAAASVDWAPAGQWDKADTVVTGDYSHNRYSVQFNRTEEALTPSPVEGSLSLSKQRQAFYDLVRLQDSIPLSDPRYSERAAEVLGTIAARYGITEAEMKEIDYEGIRKGWPMPPPP